jgi:hypothetical protein
MIAFIPKITPTIGPIVAIKHAIGIHAIAAKANLLLDLGGKGVAI